MKNFPFIGVVIILMLCMGLCGCGEAEPVAPVNVAAYVTPSSAPVATPISTTPTPLPMPTIDITPGPTPTPTPNSYKASVGFVGDILMMTGQITNAKTETGYDFSDSFLPMEPLFNAVDVMCANFEGTFGGEEAGYTQPRETQAPATAENPTPTRAPFQSFSAPDALAHNLKAAGIDVVTTANNHTMDRDDDGLFRTIAVLRDAGIKNIGTALSQNDFLTPCVLDINGIKLGFVGATQILNSTAPSIDKDNRAFAVTMLEESMVRAQISACTEAGAEFIIVMVHWGYEHKTDVDSSQYKYADRLIDWGADAIIGSHSHCPEPMEWREGLRDGKPIKVPVVYSLGNFISNMSQELAQTGLYVRLDIKKGETGVYCESFSYLPLLCCRDVGGISQKSGIHQTVPCFVENEKLVGQYSQDESIQRRMLKADRAVEEICFVKGQEGINIIKWSDIYAGEA